jgi:hypothetical protein
MESYSCSIMSGNDGSAPSSRFSSARIGKGAASFVCQPDQGSHPAFQPRVGIFGPLEQSLCALDPTVESLARMAYDTAR